MQLLATAGENGPDMSKLQMRSISTKLLIKGGNFKYEHSPFSTQLYAGTTPIIMNNHVIGSHAEIRKSENKNVKLLYLELCLKKGNNSNEAVCCGYSQNHSKTIPVSFNNIGFGAEIRKHDCMSVKIHSSIIETTSSKFYILPPGSLDYEFAVNIWHLCNHGTLANNPTWLHLFKDTLFGLDRSQNP